MKKPRKANNRAIMRASNTRALTHILKLGYRDILLRTHCKHKDYVSNIERKYACTDYWNLFDGMCFNPKGHLVFIQIKTNAWANKKEIDNFCNQHKIIAISINVSNKKGRWEVALRTHPTNIVSKGLKSPTT